MGSGQCAVRRDSWRDDAGQHTSLLRVTSEQLVKYPNGYSLALAEGTKIRSEVSTIIKKMRPHDSSKTIHFTALSPGKRPLLGSDVTPKPPSIEDTGQALYHT